jgi:hypothetical protein
LACAERLNLDYVLLVELRQRDRRVRHEARPNVDDLMLVGPNVDDLMNYSVDAMTCYQKTVCLKDVMTLP